MYKGFSHICRSERHLVWWTLHLINECFIKGHTSSCLEEILLYGVETQTWTRLRIKRIFWMESPASQVEPNSDVPDEACDYPGGEPSVLWAESSGCDRQMDRLNCRYMSEWTRLGHQKHSEKELGKMVLGKRIWGLKKDCTHGLTWNSDILKAGREGNGVRESDVIMTSWFLIAEWLGWGRDCLQEPN